MRTLAHAENITEKEVFPTVLLRCQYIICLTSNSGRFCQNLGADLAVIKSMDENQFLYDLLKNTSNVRAVEIGLLRRADKKFYWIDNRTGEVSYEKWHSGEPNNFGGV